MVSAIQGGKFWFFRGDIMKIRVAAISFTVLALICAFLFSQGVFNSGPASAQDISNTPEILPLGGGSAPFRPTDNITEEQRGRIKQEIRENIERLDREGRLQPARPELVPLAWPLAKAAGVTDFNVEAISNYVDQNALFPNQLRDWNCGTRTYDTTAAYNHAGIDMFTWPFTWKKVDDSSVEIIAAAPGTIVSKSDGNFDRNCAFNSSNWNAVYIRHSDNSIAWYGHMKNGSTTQKGVGDTVVAGEKLGIVGSSGNSTGPHLHFELYNGAGQLQDPYQGTCNTINNFSWWANQEPYRNSRINALKTHSAAPVFNACPATETTNEKTVFQPGETVFVISYFRDQLPGQQAQYSLVRPDGTTFQSWNQSLTQTFDASYWFWTWSLPTNAPNGSWKVRAVYNSATYETPFVVGQANPFANVSGRVTTPAGQNLRNATVTIVDSNSVRRTATTSSFGLYSFENVATGGSYTITVGSKRYRFSPRTLQISGNLTGIDFIGLE